MRVSLLLVPLAGALLPGCGHKEAASAPTPPPADTAASAPANQDAGAAVQPAPAPAPAGNAPSQADPYLTELLRREASRSGHVPADFNELKKKVDSVPRPPAGKKWYVDTASMEVRAVPQ